MHRLCRYFAVLLTTFLLIPGLTLYCLPPPPLLRGVDFSTAVEDARGTLLRLTLSSDSKYRLFVPLASIAPDLIQATLLQEDQYFYHHPGVNPVALIRAVLSSYVWRTRRLGASTITMQVARLRYGIYSKTWAGKCRQLWRALQLERYYSKQQILEAYLTLAPYGNNVEGVGAASLIYFGKPAGQLTLPEALTLAVIPQHPARRMTEQAPLQLARNRLFDRYIKVYPEAHHHAAAMYLPLQLQPIRSLPFLAPHFVDQVLALKQPGHILVTTLELPLQTLLEKVTRRYIASKQGVGVTNAAVLLLDTRDMAVKAMLGSVNFFDDTIGGQINATGISRSPGSTLKPFIYALALEQGLIHPGTVLADVPHHFGNYHPENFDRNFVGPLTAREALRTSRNIPAIALAEQLHAPDLYQFLQQAHVQHLEAADWYGLALVLGGAEMTMMELVGLYAMLANEGMWRPLHYLSNDQTTRAERERLLSPEASYLILDMLAQTGARPATAIKTGTSSGFRDAWTLGVFGPYVLAVWVGNVNNQGNPALIGKDMAAPLFMALTQALQGQVDIPEKSFDRTLNLKKIAVCKASGMLPTRYCPDTEEVWFIPGKSPIKTDTVYREIAINPVTGLRACHFDQHTRFAVYECWPSNLLAIFRRAGIERRIPPPHDTDCQQLASTKGLAPQVVSPQAGVQYVARAQQAAVIPLSAVVDAEVQSLYWFVDATFLGKTARDKTLIWHANPGHYTVRAVDDAGRADARAVTVQQVG